MEVRCTQCGADVAIAADTSLLQCPYCSTALAVQAGETVFREVLLPTVREAEAADHLRRFMAGRETVAGLDKHARIGTPQLVYFPFWAFRIDESAGERIVLEPAAPSSLQGLQGMTLPAGEPRSWTPELTGTSPLLEAEVPLATARTWLDDRLNAPAVRRTMLYHIPIYRFSYTYKNRSYRAAVEGVSGRVLPADFPAKAEAPFVLVAGLALAVFGIEGLLISNLFVKAVVYGISAVPLFVLAWIISRKV